MKVSLTQIAVTLHLCFHAAVGFVPFGGFSYGRWHLKLNDSSPRMHRATLHVLLMVATRVLLGHKADGDKQYLFVSSVSFTVSHLCFNVTLTVARRFLVPLVVSRFANVPALHAVRCQMNNAGR